MTPSENKRKMPRMQVDLPASVHWSVSNKTSDVNIKNLSIHGLSFQSSRYVAQGTPFELTIPGQKKDLKRKKIHAVVVRCETGEIFSAEKFKIGAKFLFESNFFVKPKKVAPPLKTSAAVQPFHPQPPAQATHQKETLGLFGQTGKENAPHRPFGTIRVREIKAEFLQYIQTSKNIKTTQTLIKIKESRLIDSHLPSASTVDLPENSLEDLPESDFPPANAVGKFARKLLPDRR
jgi:PilZ domain-containing protein